MVVLADRNGGLERGNVAFALIGRGLDIMLQLKKSSGVIMDEILIE